MVEISKDVKRAAQWRRQMAAAAMAAMVAVAGITWLAPQVASAAPRTIPGAAASKTAGGDSPRTGKAGKKDVTGKLNLNTATVDELVLLPGVGPSKAERVVAWRAKHGPFKRVADLRKVRGFGYKTLKKLEPYLDVKGDSTIAAR